MTVEEIIVECYEQLGEPSDLDPHDGDGVFSLLTPGAAKILKWVNRGYQRLANWKMPNGTLLRFASLNRDMFFTTDYLLGEVVSATPSGVVLTGLTLSDGTTAWDPTGVSMMGWVLEVTSGTESGKRSVITAVLGVGSYMLDRPFQTPPPRR